MAFITLEFITSSAGLIYSFILYDVLLILCLYVHKMRYYLAIITNMSSIEGEKSI